MVRIGLAFFFFWGRAVLWELSNGVRLDVGSGAGVALLGELASMARRGCSAFELDERLAAWDGARDGAVWRAGLDMVATRRVEAAGGGPELFGVRRARDARGGAGEPIPVSSAARLLGVHARHIEKLIQTRSLELLVVDGVRCINLVEIDRALYRPGAGRMKSSEGGCSWWQQELGSVAIRFGDTAGGRLRFSCIAKSENPQIAATGPDGLRTAVLCPYWTDLLVLSVWSGGAWLQRFSPASGSFLRVSCDGDPQLFAEGQLAAVGSPVVGDAASAAFDRMQRWSRSGRKRTDSTFPPLTG